MDPAAPPAPAVLIVDDNPSMLAAVRDLLTATFDALHPLAATRGGEAMAMFAASRPALVVMDVQLPDADGIDLTREMLRMSPTCVVVISMLSEADLPARAFAAGATAFIPKDRLFSELADVVERLPGFRRRRP